MKSHYLEAVSNPKGFGSEFYTRLMDSCPKPPSVNKILIRAGEGKAQILHAFLSRYNNSPVGILPSEWDEDTHKGSLIPQQIITAHKASVFNLEDFFAKAEPGREGWLVSLATDVHQYAGGVILDKPKQITSKVETMNYLFGLLGGSEAHQFKATSSAAVLAKDLMYPSEKGRGLVSREVHHFEVSPFSREEIEFYLYGLVGMDGSYPYSMKELLDRLVGEYQLSDDEIHFLERELTLQEIHSTNGGLRWLHPLFEHHIVAIDGTSQESEDFELKRNALFLSLMGSPKEAAYLISYLNNPVIWNEVDGRGSKNLYRQLNDDWREMVFVDGDRAVILHTMTRDDIPEVSELTITNLMNGSNHSVLDDGHRRSYAIVNTPTEFERTFLNEGNRLTIVLRSLEGELIGYVLTRESDDDPMTLAIKRIHTAKNWQRKKGIGGLMLDRVEDYCRENGYGNLVVDASGNSSTFFSGHDFATEVIVPTDIGVFARLNGSAPQVTKMRKVIS